MKTGKPTLLILAAGGGRRFGGYKQLAPIGPSGETLLEYSAFDALGAGFGRVLLVVRPQAEALFRRRLDAGLARRVPVAYVHQRLEAPSSDSGPAVSRRRPWGTAHAVLAAEGEVDRPFVVVNADDFYGAAAFAASAAFLDRPSAATESTASSAAAEKSARLAAVGFRLADTLSPSGPVSRAVLEVDAGGRLRAAVELPAVERRGGRILGRDDTGRERSLTGRELVSMNMWALTEALFPELRHRFGEFASRRGGDEDAEFRLPDVIQSLSAEGRFRVDVLVAGGEWCGLTFPEDHERVRAKIASLVAAGRYPENLWE